MSNIPKLRDEHLRLLGTIRRMGALIERREPPPPLHIFALRHELTTTLIAHLEVEDGVLYPPLINSPDTQIAATARAFSEEMGGLADAYSAHCQQWTADAIAADWGGFCIQCRRILDALTIRITRENCELYPLLDTARAA